MHKLSMVGVVVLVSAYACGSSGGAGAGGNVAGGISAPFISNGVKSSAGAWGIVPRTVDDGNSTFTVQELFVVFSDIDVCATLGSAIDANTVANANDSNSSLSPESFTLTLINKNFGLPTNGNYDVADNPNDLAAGSVGLADVEYTPANIAAGSKVYQASSGSVTLSSAPSSATAGTVAGTFSTAFVSYTVSAETDAQVLDSSAPTGTAAGSATGTFNASYCAALSAALTAAEAEGSSGGSISGDANSTVGITDPNVQMLPRTLTKQQQQLARMLRQARVSHR